MKNSHGYNHKLFVSVFESKTESGAKVLNISRISCRRPKIAGDYYAVYVDSKHDTSRVVEYMQSMFAPGQLITLSSHLVKGK